MNLLGKSFLTLKDFNFQEIEYLLNLAKKVKNEKKNNIFPLRLNRKNIVLIFEKKSTRTRCAFEIAGYDEGANITYLTNSQIEEKESIEDTAKILGRYYDGIEFRGFDHKTAELLAKYSGIPVWNGLTDLYHPTQILADFLTILEHKNTSLNKIKLTYVGDLRNNVANSLMIGAAKMGMHYVGLGPKSLFPDKKSIKSIQEYVKKSGAIIEFTENISEGVKNSNVIYTDVWASMGEEKILSDRISLLKNYQVNKDMMQKTGIHDTLFLHCLPANHDRKTKIGEMVYKNFGISEMEVSDEVFQSYNSKVFDQAENRIHTIKALMIATISREEI